jgi:hypothetical protein
MLFDAVDRLGSRRLADVVEFRTSGEALVLNNVAENT